MSAEVRQSQLYIVNESSVQQMSRIRQHLNQFYTAFLSISHINGSGKVDDSAYDIWINLCLITSKVRPSFMIQWVDYLNPKVFEYIMSLLINYRDGLDDRDIDYRLLFITDRQGVIVTTYYSYYKNNLRKTIADYSSKIPNGFDPRSQAARSDLLLGLILGYPAAGEVTLDPGDIEYLDRNEQPPGRHIFSLFIVTYGSGTQQFFGNIYRSDSCRNKLYEFYNRVVTAIKVYDPESLVLVQDTQGSLVPSNATYRQSPIKLITITPELEKEYQSYIKDKARLEKNWNDNFDRIFEIGYEYNKYLR